MANYLQNRTLLRTFTGIGQNITININNYKFYLFEVLDTNNNIIAHINLSMTEFKKYTESTPLYLSNSNCYCTSNVIRANVNSGKLSVYGIN